MCGIVGYAGKRQAQDILMNGLSHLEYRGYDSAGIAVMDQSVIRLAKSKGRLTNLERMLERCSLPGCIGIGHTRWATHGEPSDLNAHPHTDMKGDIAIVHNGIIENHDQLRTELKARGCTFVSQTDTEVIAHLLHTLCQGDMLSALQRVQGILEGSYALAVITAKEPDKIYCTRKDSPLVIGLADDEQLLASDIPALLSYTREVELLGDKEIAVLSPDGVRLFDPYGRERRCRPVHIDWDAEAAEKGGFPHFMIKEIHEEPHALSKTYSAHVDIHTLLPRKEAFPLTSREAQNLTGLTITACGTAFHAGIAGKYIIEKLAHLPVQVDVASEFRYRRPILKSTDLVLAISQSGETADTLAAMREAARLGAKTMALTNVLGSSIAREADKNVMYTYAGPEIAVASTKAYMTQLEMMVLLAIDLAVKRGTMTDAQASELLREMADLPPKAEAVLKDCEDEIQRFSSRYCDKKLFIFIGRGLDYALSLEASLKLKEVSYIMSEAYAAGELKHGTIALIEPGTPVCALVTQSALADKTLANIREVKSRGAKSLIICPGSLREKCAAEADTLWVIPDAPDILLPALAVIPVQMLAYYMSVNRGCDVDKPRNLAKSVTVE